MAKDLTNSDVDRQNILNNDIALSEIQKTAGIKGILFEGKVIFTKDMVAEFYDVDSRTIERYITKFTDELKSNGYEVLKGKKLKSFLEVLKKDFGSDINVATKITLLGVFDFRCFLKSVFSNV